MKRSPTKEELEIAAQMRKDGRLIALCEDSYEDFYTNQAEDGDILEIDNLTVVDTGHSVRYYVQADIYIKLMQRAEQINPGSSKLFKGESLIEECKTDA